MANATSKLFVAGLLMVLPALAADSKASTDLMVYVEDSSLVPASMLLQAEAIATRMFSGIGVKVRWTTRRPADRDCDTERPTVIGVRMALKKTASASQGAFASANPYASGGVRITLFYGELHERFRDHRRLEPVVMAHVLVHEITHVVQRVVRHSEAGVMLPHWTDRDYIAMADKPLEFSADDVSLVHLGLAKPQSSACFTPKTRQ